ncbi:MAG: hypothetical protein AB1585_11650 [Thermodesulfobacteriota bacterium]
MSSISYRMSGSGSWQNLLPDASARGRYGELYRKGLFRSTETEILGNLLTLWAQAAIIRVDGEKIIPLGPIMTDNDLEVLRPWFRDTCHFMVQYITDRLDDYRSLTSTLAEGHVSSEKAAGNILTILICALTLDSWVFSRLRQEMIGSYPPRGRAGHFFFWGYAFKEGPERIFGFTTYNGLEGRRLHMIRSHGLDRSFIKDLLRRWEVWDLLNALLGQDSSGGDLFPGREPLNPDPDNLIWEEFITGGLITSDPRTRLSLPVFSGSRRAAIYHLCGEVSEKIMARLRIELNRVEILWERCSFARCSRADVFCMLFHLAYSYAADLLVAQGIIPDFPQKAGGEWGVWIA